MKFFPTLVACAAIALPVAASFTTAALAASGPIETACNRSDRQSSNRALCDCIQGVADARLGGADQRRVAGFFKDPDKAQDVKMSQRDADDAFWDRYKAFGDAAEATCAN